MRVLTTALAVVALHTAPVFAKDKITCYETSCQSTEYHLMDFDRDGEVDAVLDRIKKEYVLLNEISGKKGHRSSPEEKEKFQKMFEYMKATAQKISLDDGNLWCEYNDSKKLVGTPTVRCGDSRQEKVSQAWAVEYPFDRVEWVDIRVYASEEDKRVEGWRDPLFYISSDGMQWVIRDGGYSLIKQERINPGTLEQSILDMIRELEDRTGAIFRPNGNTILKK